MVWGYRAVSKGSFALRGFPIVKHDLVGSMENAQSISSRVGPREKPGRVR
ncbi:unnamed protein product, partial [Ascophyllum nodosum]